MGAKAPSAPAPAPVSTGQTSGAVTPPANTAVTPPAGQLQGKAKKNKKVAPSQGVKADLLNNANPVTPEMVGNYQAPYRQVNSGAYNLPSENAFDSSLSSLRKVPAKKDRSGLFAGGILASLPIMAGGAHYMLNKDAAAQIDFDSITKTAMAKYRRDKYAGIGLPALLGVTGLGVGGALYAAKKFGDSVSSAADRGILHTFGKPIAPVAPATPGGK